MFFDFHCDLLSYLAHNPYNFAYDNESRVSIPQLIDGKVAVQTMAIFTETKRGSVKSGMKQAQIYKRMATQYPDYFQRCNSNRAGVIKTLLAIENASSFFAEDELLENGVKRIHWLSSHVEKPVYMSLTWHSENRFGGGNFTSIGLKEDGKRLLQKLAGHVSAIDMSHTSDKLAESILQFIDNEKLPYKIVASHSNFRAKQDVERNLPDWLALEIKKRQGVIGLSVIKRFIGGKSFDRFLDHVQYAVENGYEDHIVLGADFFCDTATPGSLHGTKETYYFEGFDNASCYPRIQKLLEKRFAPHVIQKLAFKNAKIFMSLPMD